MNLAIIYNQWKQITTVRWDQYQISVGLTYHQSKYDFAALVLLTHKLKSVKLHLNAITSNGLQRRLEAWVERRDYWSNTATLHSSLVLSLFVERVCVYLRWQGDRWGDFRLDSAPQRWSWIGARRAARKCDSRSNPGKSVGDTRFLQSPTNIITVSK